VKPKIGFLTIGLAPRKGFLDWFPEDFFVLENGVLNEIPEEKWKDLAPEDNEVPLHTSANDREIILSSEKIEPLLEKAANKLVQNGAELIIVLCSAPLKSLKSEVPVLLPHNILRNLVDRMLPAGKLGLIAPDPGQENMMRKNWETEGRKIVFVPHPPYRGKYLADDQISLLEKCNFILGNCFGYDVSFRVFLQGKISPPVLLVREVIMVILQQLQGWEKKKNK